MRQTILVADDDADFNRFIQLSLQRSGYEVVSVYNGQAVLDFLAEESPTLLVLDVTMPGMDGFQVLRSIREEPSTVNLPIVMLTARDTDPDVLKGWNMGADLYLTKPCTVEELTTSVEDVLRYRDAQEETGTGFLPKPPF